MACQTPSVIPSSKNSDRSLRSIQVPGMYMYVTTFSDKRVHKVKLTEWAADQICKGEERTMGKYVIGYNNKKLKKY